MIPVLVLISARHSQLSCYPEQVQKDLGQAEFIEWLCWFHCQLHPNLVRVQPPIKFWKVLALWIRTSQLGMLSTC